MQQIFKVIEEVENPDLRDRGYIYWRLLAKNPKEAQRLVCMEKPLISDQDYVHDSHLLEKLIENISTLAVIYNKPPEAFVGRLRESQNKRWEEMEELRESEMLDTNYKDSTGQMMGSYQAQVQQNEYTHGLQSGNIDLLGNNPDGHASNAKPVTEQSMQPVVTEEPQVAPQQLLQQSQPSAMPDLDIMENATGLPANGQPMETPNMPMGNTEPSQPTGESQNIKIPWNTVLAPTAEGVNNKMTGLEIEAVVQRENDLMVLYLKITNRTSGPITKFLVKIDSNPYQLESGNNMQIGIGDMAPGQTQVGKSLLQTTGQKSGEAPECPFFLKVALMVSIDVFVFKVPCSFTVL